MASASSLTALPVRETWELGLSLIDLSLDDAIEIDFFVPDPLNRRFRHVPSRSHSRATSVI